MQEVGRVYFWQDGWVRDLFGDEKAFICFYGGNNLILVLNVPVFEASIRNVRTIVFRSYIRCKSCIRCDDCIQLKSCILWEDCIE